MIAPVSPPLLDDRDLALLDAVQRRVLWLATQIVHWANHERPRDDAAKVGGHQASSASLVSVLTVLYFWFLRRGDRVSIKPHASPVFHAIQYLLGVLPREQLMRFRALGGLQAYPSRTKDHDRVDFSTGSVGLGATAPNFGALAQRYAQDHFGEVSSGRFIAVVGDAELDEGSVWEALLEPSLLPLGNILWIVDLNRQSLDRVIPGIRAAQLKQLFDVAGWNVIDVKYGRRLQAAFARPGGEWLRQRIDAMSNEQYQRFLHLDGAELRRRLVERGDAGVVDPEGLRRLLDGYDDAALVELFRDLGGHDLLELAQGLRVSEQVTDRPSVVFAYTIKGWGLPIAGDPFNHSALLLPTQMEDLRRRLGVPAGGEWDAFPPASPEHALCRAAAERLAPEPAQARAAVPPIPAQLNSRHLATTSTQQAFGRILTALSRERPAVAERVVTVSPDVATSTHLAGWISKVGVWAPAPRPDYYEDYPQPIRWRESRQGQHVELGISETNLFMLLGQLGLSGAMNGQPLLPIGTLYDPFVLRGLEAFNYAVYSGARFIVAGTPSGVTLSREGGMHQSVITPSIGLELPNVACYEPCFAQELEWILLASLASLADEERGEATYLRLSTKGIDQRLAALPTDPSALEERRRAVLAGAYRLRDQSGRLGYRPGANVVHLFACGAMVPEALEASRVLEDEGIYANVVNVTSADRLHRAYRRRVLGEPPAPGEHYLAALLPPAERSAPIVSVIDGHSHTLSFLGALFEARCLSLGVDAFGESGTRADLYARFAIDPPAIAATARRALRG